MMNMISLNNIGVFGKAAAPAGDPSDADLMNSLFAALLTVPVAVPPASIPLGDQSQDPEPESGSASPFGESQIPSGDSPAFANPAFQTSTLIPQTPETVGPNTNSVAEDPIPLTSDLKMNSPTKPEIADQFGDLPLPRIDVGDIVPRTLIQPTKKPPISPQLSDFHQKEISDDPPAVFVPPTPAGGFLSDFHQRELPDGDTSPAPVAPAATDLLSQFHQQAIRAEVPISVSFKPSANFAIPTRFEPAFTTGFPRVLRDVSDIIKSDGSKTVDAGSEISYAQTVVEQAGQSLLSGGGQTLERSMTEMLEPDKKLKISELSSDATFSSSLSTAARTQKAVELTPKEPALPPKIADQVELKVLDLAGLTRNVGEKRVIKIRLTPAELGTVEVTVEKNASGKISAHFQTESQQTRQALNDSLPQLRESLERSGMNVGDLDTSCASFSSAGNNSGRDGAKEFGTAESSAAGILNFDGLSTTEDDASDRLVNLQA